MPTLALGTLSSTLTDFSPRVDNPVRRYIGFGFKASQGMSHDLGCTLPNLPSHLSVGGNPAVGDLANRGINPLPGGPVRYLEAQTHGSHPPTVARDWTNCPHRSGKRQVGTAVNCFGQYAPCRKPRCRYRTPCQRQADDPKPGHRSYRSSGFMASGPNRTA